MATVERPLPYPDADTLPFWEACREHRLIAQRCRDCQRWRWLPTGFCPACHSWSFSWEELDGRGVVLSFAVMHRAFNPAFAEDVPYVVAEVTMDGTDGNVTMLSNIVGCPWAEVRVGMAVRVRFDDIAPGVTMHRFEPVPS